MNLQRMGSKGREPLKLFTALCGKNRKLPLEAWQSPEILKLIERENFTNEAIAFEPTHRSLFIAVFCEPAAQEVEILKASYPDRPLCLDRFIFEQGMAFAKQDYSGA